MAMRTGKRSPALLAVAAIVGVLLLGLAGDLSPSSGRATAQEAPPLDEFVADMKSDEGLFPVYVNDRDQVFFEIREENFNRDFLVVVQIARGIGESFLLTGFPLETQMVTFRLRKDRIELVARNPLFRAREGTPQGRMVERGFRENVLAVFPVAAAQPEEGRYLIEVTRFFLKDPGLAPVLPFLYGVGFRIDPNRSSFVYAKSFPENVELEVDLTYAASRAFPSRTLPDPTSLPVAIHYSILRLPEEPMKPRLADDRVGYFVTTYKDYDRQGGRTGIVRIVNRWRLEKKDPYAPLSEPVKPIVFYLEDTIPEELRPYVKEGVEAWNKAFEAAGFKNAIRAVDAPDDPDFDPGDARYSTIRWVPSVTSVFAIGPSDVDPRSGEILNADILVVADWVRALTGQRDLLAHVRSPLDFLRQEAEALRLAYRLNPDYARRLCAYGASLLPYFVTWRLTLIADGVIDADEPVPLEYVGAAIREVVMHEVGHSLGLRHNFKASIAIPFDKLHDPDYTRQYGVSASVMDYNPPNISPDRDAQGEYYNSTVGPYDVWAIQWGYMPVGNETLDRPHPRLQAIAQEHAQKEHFYGTDEDGWLYPYALDPWTNQFDLGGDPIAYYKGLQRLTDRLWAEVEERLVEEDGELWPVRGAIHTLLYQQTQGYFWTTKYIGGVYVTRAHKDDPAGLVPFRPVPAEEQRQALRFVLEAFRPDILREFPKELLDKAPPPRWWDRYSGWRFGTRFTYPLHDVVTGMRAALLEILFWPERLARIRDNAYRSEEPNPFTLEELFRGVTDAIWQDVLVGLPSADSFQRALQSLYLDRLLQMAVPEGSPAGERSSRLPAPSAASVPLGLPGSNALPSTDAPFGLGTERDPWLEAYGGAGTDPIALHPNPAFVAPRVDEARSLAQAELERIDRAIEQVLAEGVFDSTLEAHLREAQRRIERVLGR